MGQVQRKLDLPVASSDMTWDAGAALKRVKAWASTESGEIDFDKFFRAFLWRDPVKKENITAYKLPYADVINGRLTVVPAAIRNASARLPQTDIPAEDKARVARVLEAWKRQIGIGEYRKDDERVEDESAEKAERVEKVYSSIDELPENVRKLKSAKRKRQWMHVWNATYKRMKDSGASNEEAERRAFAAANSVVLKKGFFKTLIDFIVDGAIDEAISESIDESIDKSTNESVDAQQLAESLHTSIDATFKNANVTREVVVKGLSNGLVYGIVYEPYSIDTQGHFTTPEEIEKAAHDFLPRACMNIHHESDLQDVEVVESYIAPIDFVINKEIVKRGSWVLVSRVNDPELRKSIEAGEITGYSLEGTATLVEVEV